MLIFASGARAFLTQRRKGAKAQSVFFPLGDFATLRLCDERSFLSVESSDAESGWFHSLWLRLAALGHPWFTQFL
jgi:hypothetical protein